MRHGAVLGPAHEPGILRKSAGRMTGRLRFPGCGAPLHLGTVDEEIQAALARGITTVVGHFEKKSAKEFKNYRKAASAFPDFLTLCVVGKANVEVPMNTVYLYTQGEKRVYDESGLVSAREP